MIAFCGAVPLRAQEHETAQEIEDGGRVFSTVCANCHGPDGDEVAGIDLGRRIFRRAKTDRDVIDTIRNGIPGTAMPATSMSDAQAAQIVAYLNTFAASRLRQATTGNSESGKHVFQTKGACLTCHRVQGMGARIGPDLSNIGRLRRSSELAASILEPNKEILYTNRSLRVVDQKGRSVTGRLLNIDTFTIQLLDSNEQLRSFDKSTLRGYEFVDTSSMPSYRGKLTEHELADVVSYLVSLKESREEP